MVFEQGWIYTSLKMMKAVGIDHPIDAMATASGQDLTHFKAWYFQAGTPTVNFHELINIPGFRNHSCAINLPDT